VIDRQKVETILLRRFPGATCDQAAISANAILGLHEEWEELHCHHFEQVAAEQAEARSSVSSGDAAYESPVSWSRSSSARSTGSRRLYPSASP
jgi:hypothetical protein